MESNISRTALVEQNGFSISVIFRKSSSKYCWGTMVIFYHSVDLYQREECGAAIDWWAFSRHGISTF